MVSKVFAQTDFMTEPRLESRSGITELLLMKIKIYQGKGHHLPHIHIDYGNENLVVSYSIGNRKNRRIDPFYFALQI